MIHVIDNNEVNARIEKTNSYRQMMEGWAFKDLMRTIQQEKSDRLDQLMSKRGAEDLDITKGFVQCVNFIEAHLGFVTGKS